MKFYKITRNFIDMEFRKNLIIDLRINEYEVVD